MYCCGGVNLTVSPSQNLQLKPVPTACQQAPAAAGSSLQLSADLAGQCNGMIRKRRSSLSGSRQHDTSGTGMHPPLGPQRAWQQREPRAHAAPAADLVGTTPGQGCHAISSPDLLSVADDDGYQLPRSHQQDSAACAAGSGNQPALADASNSAKRLSLTANMARGEKQAESPDPKIDAALTTAAAAAAEGTGAGCRYGGQGGAAADGAAVEEDAAGKMVQQCESIFSFL
jgi:hypothetical protein